MEFADVRVLAATDWGPVVIALGAAIPGLVAAVIGFLNRKALRTSNGTTVGEQIEQTHAIVTQTHEAATKAAAALTAREKRY